MTLILIHAIDALEFEGKLLFNFRVMFGESHNWVVSRTYEDFCLLHQDLQEKYGTSTPPRLPKFKDRTSRRKGKNNDDNDTGGRGLFSRLKKKENTLEEVESAKEDLGDYLQSVVASCDLWQPQIFRINVPHPDERSRPHIPIISSLFDFLEFEQYLTLPSCASDQPLLEAQTSVSAPQTSRSLLHDVSMDSNDTNNEGDSIPPTQSRFAATLLPQPGEGAAGGGGMHHHTQLDSSVLALAAAATDLTTQIQIRVKNFTVYNNDRIDYHIHVSLCGHQWVISKRYSELEELHDQLKSIYGEEGVVPSFKQSRVMSWKKLDQKTGLLRQKFFNEYLKEVILSIDQWQPQGLVTSFELERVSVEGLRSRVTVCVNQILFEFFRFESHIAELNGEDAAHALGEHQNALTEEAKVAVQKKARSDRRAAMHNAIQKQAKALQHRHATEEEVVALEEGIASLRDDKDIIRFFEHFLTTGQIVTDMHALEQSEHHHHPRIVKLAGKTTTTTTTRLADSVNMSSYESGGTPSSVSPRESPHSSMPSPSNPYQHGSPPPFLLSPVKALGSGSGSGGGGGASGTAAPPPPLSMQSSRRFLIDKTACNESIVVGVDAAQLLRFVEPISFNDTKIAVIKLFTPALVNVDSLQEVFDLLWYDWEAARADVEAILFAE